ncbi:MAG: hypothetical protein U9R19_16720, partial [Bacteroidota bacterium]|nr:hypothetical protein [Bacteroidota bacterium]
MDKNFIRILIVVMLAALVGLIILQTIYLRDAIKVKDNHFSQLVSQSLAETFQQLEINKTMEYFNIDTFSSEKAHAIQKPIKKENTIEGSIGFEFMIDEGITYLEDTFFCTSNVRISVFSSDSMVFAIENDIGEIESQTYYFGNNNRKKSYNNNPRENVVSKQFGYIENMVGRILSIDRGTKWELNQRELETTIRQSLENNGISLDFEYAVLEPSTGYILSSSNFQLQSEKDIYRIQITPDNFFAQANYLELFFPHKESFLLSSTGTMGISSFILILTIIGLFAVSLIIIIRQKKLSEMKNDFINNMTHELKTPISTL